MMSGTLIQLDYAKRPRWHRRKSFRWAVILMALIAVAGSAWRWGPEKWERAELLYWQWRCMNYSPAADEIVYDQEPSGKSPLLDDHRGYLPLVKPGYEGPAITTAAATTPNCASQFTKFTLELILRPSPKLAPPIIFMHERSSPSGRKYLIILHGIVGEDGSAFENVGEIWAIEDSWKPASLDEAIQPASSTDFPFGVRLLNCSIAKRLRIFAGQADPRDPTHFSIRFEVGGLPGIVDGDVSDEIAANNPFAPGGYVARVKLTERRAE